eukprot:TRINITY_DN17213_c0_g1_i1.p1 TRINITY_DN17213_c0_g1~~TRINITY_DN17213_c0_g1_i1.p1  ORF type:complete len:343 (-),score=82.98 TRINITY_DN17213_c0_g1_i1:28-1032(-)
MAAAATVVLTVGTYGHQLVGYAVTVEQREKEEDAGAAEGKEKKDEKKLCQEDSVVLRPTFGLTPHEAPVKVVSASDQSVTGDFLASGGDDETIKVYNLRKKIEVGTLHQHTGTITTLNFFGHHMLSGSEDGSVCFWRTNDWEVMRVLKAHTGGVKGLAIHPSGKVALSFGILDHFLKMWDLHRGSHIHSTKLPFVPELLNWHPNGQQFVITYTKKSIVYNAKLEEIHEFEHESPPRSQLFYLGHLFVGHQNGAVSEWDISTGKRVSGWQLAGNPRIRGVVAFTLRGTNNKRLQCIATACSDGTITVWDAENDHRELARCNADVRVTCFAASSLA